MSLKRPVTLAQARRWPGAAQRRESFCARMGGMRRKLTGPEAASDPDSPINRALAAWDCDKPALLEKSHVSKGVRPMKITPAMVGSEARKNPKMTPRQQVTRWAQDMGLRASSGDGWVSISDKRSDWSETFDNWSQAMQWARAAYDARRDESKPWPWDAKKNPANTAPKSPKYKNAAKSIKSDDPSMIGYAVHRPATPRSPIGIFRSKQDAMKFAREMADKKSTQFAVSRIKHMGYGAGL